MSVQTVLVSEAVLPNLTEMRKQAIKPATLGPVVLFELLLDTPGLALSLLMLIGLSSYASP
ncbi:MAG: hypothetical protein ACI802_001116 [Candidatus Paceibacteria bacterium]|jgi:hypothetical protein